MKRVKQLLCLLLAMIMIITAVPNMQAYATGAVTPNGGKKHGNMGGLTTCHGGASVSKQGFRLYIVDENGNVVSIFKTHDKKGNVIEAQARDLYIGVNEGTTTVGDDLRVGDGDLAPGRMRAPAGMPSAFVGQNWTTNGAKLAQWMNTKEWRWIDYTDKKGKKHHEHRKVKNCQYLCYYAMGIRAFNMATDYESKYTIVLEPTVFHVVWRSTSKSSSTGTSFYGTAHDWLQKYNKMGVAKTWTSSCESYVLQCALTLKRNEHDLTKPTSEVTKSKQLTLKRVGSQGFGIHFYTLNGGSDPDDTHIFDYHYNSSKFRPEKAPSPKKSKESWVTIVKTYRVKKIKKDGNIQYIDKGTYVRKNNPARIRIENEPTSKVQYHVIGYQTTDKVKKDIDALKWKSIMEDKEQVGNVTKHATVKPNNNAVVTTVTLHKKIEKQRDPKTHKKKTVKQDHDEIVLYVLLQKEQKEKPISGDYTLKQSQISKRVDLYKTEKDKNILKGHSFVWDSSALNDACSGHTYYCGGEYCSGHTYYCSWSLDDTSLSLAIMNARYRADEYKYNIAYKAWDDEWEDTEVANQC